MTNNQIIIIGGGTSIQEGIQKGLWAKLRGRVSFGLNYSYNYFPATAQFYVDKSFYTDEIKKETFYQLPLVIGKWHRRMKPISPTTLQIQASSKYDPTLKTGCYKSSLCGIFALSVACFLKPKEIFLLGYDYGGTGKDKQDRPKTHFYQGEIQHRGIGKINYYECLGRADRDYKPFIDAGACNIYNVSPNSKINVFPKLTYDEFFKKLKNTTYSQDTLRKRIRESLKPVVQ